jgi:ParB family chromosome partitioning protein
MSAIDTAGYKELYLDIDHIIPSENNFYPLSEIEELAENIEQVGLLQPLLIGRVDGVDRLLSGHRRRAALLLLNEKKPQKIWCMAKEMTQNEFMYTLISANAFTRKLDDATLLEQAKQLEYWTNKAVEEGTIRISGRKRDFIADKLHISPTKMAQINKINSSLIEEGKQAVKDGDMSFSKAYETSKLPEETQRMVIQDGSLLSSDVQKMVREQRQKINISYSSDESADEEQADLPVEEVSSVSFKIHTGEPEKIAPPEYSENALEHLKRERDNYKNYLALAEMQGKNYERFQIIYDALSHYLDYVSQK